MKLFILLFLFSLPVYSLEITEGSPLNMKWLIINFAKEKEVTLNGKLTVEKDCNHISINNEKLTKLTGNSYFLGFDQFQTVMACPQVKKTKIDLPLKPFTVKRPKAGTVMILVPAGANFIQSK